MKTQEKENGVKGEEKRKIEKEKEDGDVEAEEKQEASVGSNFEGNIFTGNSVNLSWDDFHSGDDKGKFNKYRCPVYNGLLFSSVI